MSPFSQIGSQIGRQVNAHYGYGGGIDRDFSPVLNYLDERRCPQLLPLRRRPRRRVEDINIEAHDSNTLVIEGVTHRAGAGQYPDAPVPSQHGSGGEEDQFVKVHVDDHNTEQAVAATAPPAAQSEKTQLQTMQSAPTQAFPPPPQQPLDGPHPHHARHQTSYGAPPPSQQGPYRDTDRRVLLSERLTGPFHRTFAFPTPVNEEGVQAVVENGVLFLTVPKRDRSVKRGRKIAVRSARDGEFVGQGGNAGISSFVFGLGSQDNPASQIDATTNSSALTLRTAQRHDRNGAWELQPPAAPWQPAMPELLKPISPSPQLSHAQNLREDALRRLSRSPHPYHRQRFELPHASERLRANTPPKQLPLLSRQNTDDDERDGGRSGPESYRESTNSDSGTEADDEHFFERPPCAQAEAS
ncbi:hypothetical protein G7Y89_g3204 [Cudoniella acicularis]|uniref:SHSP domain-containing protein n=1 Tax=Cudoniella acicularis TaxID=354080 RepID=A0A8H4RRU1_9HELO|nr:hypothetical protein G7Y89_g3204 [Cudoniella acicularis]